MQQKTLAIFDLDHTLIAADSSQLWFEHMLHLGWANAELKAQHQQLMLAYEQRSLDMQAYLQLSLAPLRGRVVAEVEAQVQALLEKQLLALLYPGVFELLAQHREQGHVLLLLSASEDFLVEPWQGILNLDDAIGVETQRRQGRFTGEAGARISYGDGKIQALQAWLAQQPWHMADSYFYSDSHNDLPLLQWVGHPRPTHANPLLAAEAAHQGWPMLALS